MKSSISVSQVPRPLLQDGYILHLPTLPNFGVSDESGLCFLEAMLLFDASQISLPDLGPTAKSNSTTNQNLVERTN